MTLSLEPENSSGSFFIHSFHAALRQAIQDRHFDSDTETNPRCKSCLVAPD